MPQQPQCWHLTIPNLLNETNLAILRSVRTYDTPSDVPDLSIHIGVISKVFQTSVNSSLFCCDAQELGSHAFQWMLKQRLSRAKPCAESKATLKRFRVNTHSIRDLISASFRKAIDACLIIICEVSGANNFPVVLSGIKIVRLLFFSARNSKTVLTRYQKAQLHAWIDGVTTGRGR